MKEKEQHPHQVTLETFKRIQGMCQISVSHSRISKVAKFSVIYDCHSFFTHYYARDSVFIFRQVESSPS